MGSAPRQLPLVLPSGEKFFIPEIRLEISNLTGASVRLDPQMLVASREFFLTCPESIFLVTGPYTRPVLNQRDASFALQGESAADFSRGWFTVCHLMQRVNTAGLPVMMQIYNPDDPEFYGYFVRDSEAEGTRVYALVAGLEYQEYADLLTTSRIFYIWPKENYSTLHWLNRLTDTGLTALPFQT
jgi:hypothetical protein